MKTRIRKNILLMALFAATVLSSCEQVIDYELDNIEEKLVIDGLITDKPGPHYVKLSLTGPYLKNQPTPRATGAIVIIRDDMNHTDTLQEQLPGEYITDTTIIKGIVGHAYELYVNYAGKEYKAKSRILPMSDIDSISYTYHKASPLYEEDGYYVTMYAQEPKGLGNNYRFKFIENGKFSLRSDRFIIVNDDYVDGQFVTFTTPFKVNRNDTIVLEGQSLTKAAYDYYTALTVQLNPNGFFDTPPANLPTNVTGGALGFFNTVATKSIGIRIK